MARNSAATWEPVGDVESDSEPGVRHEIKRRRSDGHLGCDCLSYRFARKSAKTCKHIIALTESDAAVRLIARSAAVVPRAPVRHTTGGETFTVTRRTIAFGPIAV